VQALIAGNDMLCLPENVPVAIEAVKTAVKKKRLSWNDIDQKVRRVLHAKYSLGLSQPQVIDTTNLVSDLNRPTDAFRQKVAANVITVMTNSAGLLPFTATGRMAYIGVGAATLNTFGQRLKTDFGADTYLFPNNAKPVPIFCCSIPSGMVGTQES
jgi:beta-glucosidase-like glycosyl hydrolase